MAEPVTHRHAPRGRSSGPRGSHAALRAGSALLLICLGSLASGCALFGPTGGTAPRPARTDLAASAGAGDAGPIGDYLETMQLLADGDALTRADVFRAAEEAADYAPTTANRMRYALALAVPGHPGSDAEQAAIRLRQLMAAGDALLPAERSLVAIQLRYVEQLMVLEGNGIELQQRLDAAVTERNAVAAERIRILQAENAQLKADLEDASAMLEAITSIEESISERGGQ